MQGSTGLDSVKTEIYEDLWIDFSAMKMNGSYWKYFFIMLSLDTKNTEKIRKKIKIIGSNVQIKAIRGLGYKLEVEN